MLNFVLTFEAAGRKMSQNFHRSLERQSMKNQTTKIKSNKLYTDDNQLKYYSIPQDILKSAKTIMKL